MDWEPNAQDHMLRQVVPKVAGFPCPSLSSQETRCSYSLEIKSAVQVFPSCRRLKAGGLPSSRAVLGLSTGCCQWERSLAVHEETPGRHFAMGSKVLFFSGNSLPLPRISTESTVQVSGTNAVIVVTLSPHVCPQLQTNYFSVLACLLSSGGSHNHTLHTPSNCVLEGTVPSPPPSSTPPHWEHRLATKAAEISRVTFSGFEL